MEYLDNLEALKPYISINNYQFLLRKENCAVKILPAQTHGHHHLYVNEEPIYPESIEKFCETQMREYMAKPMRVDFGWRAIVTRYHNNNTFNNGYKMDFILNLMYEHLLLSAPLHGDRSPLSTTFLSAFSTIIGIGSGYHIERLIEETNSKVYIICDYYIDFLQASLSFLNWRELITKLEQRGATLRFIIGEDPAEVAEAWAYITKQADKGLLPGSYFYPHFDMDPENKLYHHISLRFNEVRNYNGWIEDELLHANNIMNTFYATAANKFKDDKRHLICSVKEDKATHTRPIVVFGSGPSSLDFMPVLKKYRDKLTILSVGSSIKALMENGIDPDLHVELENLELTYQLLLSLNQPERLAKIPLFSSATVFPAMHDLFASSYLFQRDGGSLPRILEAAAGMKPLIAAAASAANSAIYLAMQAQPRALFLVGIDLAYGKDKESHNSAVAYNNPQFSQYKTFYEKDSNVAIVQGNGDEYVETSRTWLHMLQQTNRLIEKTAPNFSIYNCGFGARINKASPLLYATDFDSLLSQINLSEEHKATVTNSLFNNVNIAPITSHTCENIEEILIQIIKELEQVVYEFRKVIERCQGKPMTADEFDNKMSCIFENTFEILEKNIKSENLASQISASLIDEDIRSNFHLIRQFFISVADRKLFRVFRMGLHFTDMLLQKSIARFIVEMENHINLNNSRKPVLCDDIKVDSLRLLVRWRRGLNMDDLNEIALSLRELISLQKSNYWLIEETIAEFHFNQSPLLKEIKQITDLIYEFNLPRYVQACPYCQSQKVTSDKIYFIIARIFLRSRCQSCNKDFLGDRHIIIFTIKNAHMNLARDDFEKFKDLCYEYAHIHSEWPQLLKELRDYE